LFCAAASGQTKQTHTTARQKNNSKIGVQRASNVQPSANEGWEPGQEPVGGAAQRLSPNQSIPAAAPGQGRPAAIQPRMPFALTPQEEANLDHILLAWERQSGKIKTYKCDFTRLEYGRPADSSKLPKDAHGQTLYLTKADGELKYSAPDKGMFKVTEIELYNTKTRKYEAGGPENLEHWVCDGRSIFQIDHKEKTRTEQPLPPEMHGQAISDGPLPFVFGAKAATLKLRYWMREIPSPHPADTIWLQAFPRSQSDAANYRYVEIIMGCKDFMPRAIQMFGTAYNPREGNEDRVVFSLKNVSFNGRFDNVFSDFVGPDVPFHYKKIVRPAVGQPATAGAPPARENTRAAKAPVSPLPR
jgi:TIGR03009 family protein